MSSILLFKANFTITLGLSQVEEGRLDLESLKIVQDGTSAYGMWLCAI